MTDDGQRHGEADIVEAWIDLYKQPQNSKKRDAFFWAFIALDTLTLRAPERAWPIILKILKRQPSAEVLSNLAAGPLEDLLARHGATFIDMIESEAARSHVFRDLLAGVWQRQEMSDDLWQRVQKAIGDDALIDAWMSVYQQDAGQCTVDFHRRVHEEFDKIASKEPKRALSVIVQILERKPGAHTLTALASGALKSMLVARGRDIIQDVEGEAARSPEFRELLRSLWENRMEDAVWKRIQLARRD